MLNISIRGQGAPASPIRKLVPFAEKAKESGAKVYHLNIGQPDICASDEVMHELKNCSLSSYLPYEQSQGSKVLLSNWASYLKSTGVEVSPENIFVTTGASEGLMMAMASVANPGDEVIAFEPFYANYLGFANLISVKIVPTLLSEKNDYHLPAENEIISKITKKTKAIIINNPNNPTGTVFTESELATILQIAKNFNLFIISDEAYSGICFGKANSKSIFALAGEKDKERIIIADSLSKKFNVCGARIGALISTNPDVLEVFNRFSQQRLSVATIDQVITAPLLKVGKKYIKQIAGEYEKRRNAFISTLEQSLGIKIHYPEGAFYTMVKLPIRDTDDFAKWMLTDFRYHNETVMVAPGSGFYATRGKGKSEIRVAFVLNPKDLENAAKILALGIKEYIKIKGEN